MKSAIFLAALALTGAAGAQLVGPVGGSVNSGIAGSVGGIAGGSTAVGGGARIAPPISGTVDDARGKTGEIVRGADDAVRDIGHAAADATGDTVRQAGRSAGEVHLKTGATARVDRGTRCYYEGYDGYYYEAYYRDGYYYCDQRGTAVKVQAGGR